MSARPAPRIVISLIARMITRRQQAEKQNAPGFLPGRRQFG
jgi:hypothetical protein